MARIKHVSEISYFLLRILNPMRTDKVSKARRPNTEVTMTSWWPTGSSSAIVSLECRCSCECARLKSATKSYSCKHPSEWHSGWMPSSIVLYLVLHPSL